jgi:hypothetical protein
MRQLHPFRLWLLAISSYYNAATQPGPISIREPDAKDD